MVEPQRLFQNIKKKDCHKKNNKIVQWNSYLTTLRIATTIDIMIDIKILVFFFFIWVIQIISAITSIDTASPLPPG